MSPGSQAADAAGLIGLQIVQLVRGLQAAGRDLTHGGDAAKRRGQSIAERKRAVREWEREFGKVVDLSRLSERSCP